MGNKKIILSILLLILLIPVCYAGFHMGLISATKDKVKKLDKKVEEANMTVVIKGKNIISGEAYELEPGMTVKFKSKVTNTVAGEISEPGELVLKDGASLKAQGTANDPITFIGIDPGIITFTDTSDGENSIIEYCKFEDMGVNLEVTVTIQYCKFNYSRIYVDENVQAHIKYNDFSSFPNAASHTKIISAGSSVIQYNNLTGSITPIYGDSVEIKNNNITNSNKVAVSVGPSALVDNNYIADCNGKTGPDTDGSQVDISGTYTNPQTSLVPDAGTGW